MLSFEVNKDVYILTQPGGGW